MTKRRTRLAVALAAASLLAACGGSDQPTSSGNGCRWLPTTPVVVSKPAITDTSRRGSNFVFDVTSTAVTPSRVVVEFDDRLALDIQIPGTPEHCKPFHHPVHRYHYRLPEGPVRMTVSDHAGQVDTVTAKVGAKRQWSWMQIQPPFPAEITVQSSAPAWG